MGKQITNKIMIKSTSHEICKSYSFIVIVALLSLQIDHVKPFCSLSHDKYKQNAKAKCLVSRKSFGINCDNTFALLPTLAKALQSSKDSSVQEHESNKHQQLVD